ncbi:pilin biogenesis-like protein [Alcanivorax sp. 521-1]|uniref:Pilin biogenesis-like protein n=1 Tax=Alloalcanivorax profundimaris TaxID=2735259 RepID=A0ABS0APM7_9GAMM|nr:PilC/PilY family type IV pilus protein [Alloalcanivorax profundimaris]MBF5055582.1 pilin biogenesis-like protein [Alloalcanivorax profundimaris]
MNRIRFFTVLLGAILLAPTGVHADDTEIYFSRADADSDVNKQSANVLFLIDTSGSMSGTKMSQLKTAFSSVIDGLKEGVSIGVGRFNSWNGGGGAYGGYVFYPVTEMEDTAKQNVKDLVNGLPASNNTPTMESYSEMARYMMGMSPTNYAKEGDAEQDEPTPAVNLTCSGPWWNRSCYSTSYYDSPMDMENQCETNHIVVMTDGAPTSDNDDQSVRNITKRSCNGSWECQRELAGWLLDGGRNDQGRSVKTWQVAFGVDRSSSQAANMLEVAKAGGTGPTGDPEEPGGVFFADNADSLAAAFNEILTFVSEQSETITSPGVSVNQNNRLEHLDQLYYAMFRPEEKSVWPGNLKRYRMDDGEVVDVNDSPALDTETGYVRESAKSYWTDGEADGSDVSKGGARAELSDRKLIVGNSSGNGSFTLDADKLQDMDDEDFGIPNDAVPDFDTKEEVYAALLTQWADPMHSVPLLVNYEVDDDGTDADDQTNYIFVSTNGGMLHAIDTKTGAEKFAFMPDQMLKQAYELVRSPPLKENNIRSLYGLDSSWVAYRTAKDNGDADDVYIYGGMRRGGSNYYALDVSDIDNPSLKWRIRGAWVDDSAIASPDSGFSRLGQSWSMPTLTRVKVGDTIKPVLVFGGGYDPDGHDTAGSRPAKDDVGNAVYMVDAHTGERLWSIGSDDATTQVSDMKWGVPGGIAVVDLNLDGLADYLYFGDLGGQIFRVNLDNTVDSDSDLVKGVVRLATLGGTGTADHRRFYEAPAIGYQRNGLSETLYVAIGSGYRAHPLDTDTDEGFYVLADHDFKGTDQPDVIAEGDLPVVNGASTPSLDGSGDGWRVALGDGEKVMSSATIFQGSVMFSTYQPSGDDQDSDPCVVRYGSAHAYRANMLTGEAESFSNNGDAADWDGEELEGSSIPPSVTPLSYTDDGDDGDTGGGEGGEGNGGGKPKVIFNVGLEVLGGDEIAYDMFRKQRWYPMEKNEANEYFPVGQEEDE